VGRAAFALLARDAPVPAPAQRKGFGAMLEVLTSERLSWVLAAFYFLTFGGFVAFSIYLPTLLKDEFHLPPADAGFRTAGFVVLATLLRPLGGRRRACLIRCFPRSGSVRHAAGVAVDDSLHRRRAGLRGIARPWKWRRI
jgi:hypothetical protein